MVKQTKEFLGTIKKGEAKGKSKKTTTKKKPEKLKPPSRHSSSKRKRSQVLIFVTTTHMSLKGRGKAQVISIDRRLHDFLVIRGEFSGGLKMLFGLFMQA